MICNQCIRGLTIEKKEVCGNCAGTGFMAPAVQVSVPTEPAVQADVEIEEDGKLAIKPKKVLKK